MHCQLTCYRIMYNMIMSNSGASICVPVVFRMLAFGTILIHRMTVTHLPNALTWALKINRRGIAYAILFIRNHSLMWNVTKHKKSLLFVIVCTCLCFSNPRLSEENKYVRKWPCSIPRVLRSISVDDTSGLDECRLKLWSCEELAFHR